MAEISAVKECRENRAIGSLLGVLIGDALGLGYQWYYDLDEKEKDFGSFVQDYVDPRPDGTHGFAYIHKYRYDEGVRAGDTSQNGQIFVMLLESIAEHGTSYRNEFYKKLDDFFTTINGKSLSGRYTEYPIIYAREKRLEGIEWTDIAMGSDITTGEGAMMVVALAALFKDAKVFAKEADTLLRSFVSDTFTRNNSIIFGLVVHAFINGMSLRDMPVYLKRIAFDSELRQFGGAFDNFLTPGNATLAVLFPELTSFDPKLVGVVYGLDCQFATHLAPAVYYLLHRLPDDFEMAVSCAANGGGNNVMRGALTGAVVGALNGINAIPDRWIKGLNQNEYILEKIRMVAKLV